MTPDARTIQNDPDEIMLYAINHCKDSTADYIYQDDIFEHYGEIINNGQQWFSIPFVDYESQKYYSQFYVYCFFAISEEGWSPEGNITDRYGTQKLVESINSQKKDSILLPFFNVFDFNEIPIDEFVTKTLVK